MHALPAALLAALQFGASAAVYHVRIDGGDHNQCSGLVDAASAGAVARACAWEHPFVALPPAGAPRIAGGDTLRIGAGAYRMGLGAPGSEGCDPAWPWDCFMAALPSGVSAAAPTRVSGAGVDGACASKPELWGSERAARVLNLDASSHVEVDCLEITDRSSCVEHHCHGGECAEVARCERDHAPFGDWAGSGVYARDSTDVRLRDLDVHGLALRGFHVGRVRDWRVERVAINGNGWSGWDGDLGEPDSSNAGYLHFSDVEIAWNGCAERYPGRQPFACWGQSSGGYGDGLGTAASAGEWRFERMHVHHNASDGLDLLYLRPPASVSLQHSQLHANGGNQFKASGAVDLGASVIDGNCAELGEHGLDAGDRCRAGGNAVSIVLWPGVAAQVHDNQLRGAGDCLVVVEGGDASSRVQMQRNQLQGGPMWADPARLGCGFYAHGSEARVELKDNRFSGVRAHACAPGNSCDER